MSTNINSHFDFEILYVVCSCRVGAKVHYVIGRGKKHVKIKQILGRKFFLEEISQNRFVSLLEKKQNKIRNKFPKILGNIFNVFQSIELIPIPKFAPSFGFSLLAYRFTLLDML